MLDNDKQEGENVEPGQGGNKMLGAHVLDRDGQEGLPEKGLLNPCNSPFNREEI